MTDPERPRTTPEGHTPEEPRPSELGKAGTPGAGMTGDLPHAADAREVEAGDRDEVTHHAAESHTDDAHTELSDDDHALAEPRLGPVDWPAWLFALIGVAAGLLVVALFFAAIG